MTDGPGSGHRASICVGYDQIREVCWNTRILFPMSLADSIGLVVHGVPTLSDGPVDDTQFGALEEKFKTNNERICTPEQQVASMHAEIAAKLAQVDCLEGALE